MQATAAKSLSKSHPRWYTVQCKPRQEGRALEHLQRQGFSSYLPTISVEKLQLGRRTEAIDNVPFVSRIALSSQGEPPELTPNALPRPWPEHSLVRSGKDGWAKLNIFAPTSVSRTGAQSAADGILERVTS